MALKKIQYDVRLLSTEKTLQGNMPIVYTNDLNSAEFVFNILDMTAEQLAGATATTLLYMRDGSFFQNSDVDLDGTTFTYLLKENEGNHAGLAKIQLVVKIGTAEYASQLHSFGVVSGLETKVAVEVMIHDWTTLLREARAYIAQFLVDEEGRQATFVANEQDRQLAFEASEALRQQKETERQGAEATRQQQFDDAQTARTNIFTQSETERATAFAEKYAGLEAQYATDLATLKQSDVSLTAQLAQTKDNVKANSTYYSMSKEPVVTFIDDDGHVDVYNRLYPIFSAKGIKGCSAIITGSVDVTASTLTSSQLDDLHDYGWEFLGHGHSYTANLMEFPMDSDLEYQLGEGCKGWLENRGYPVNGFVYPQGVSNERIRRFTKKYYDFAFQGNTFNEGYFVDTMRIQRIAFGSWTSSNPTVNGNSEKNTLAYYKACVDYASANNIWLIFMSHVGQQDVSQDVILSDLITYIQSSNVKILTASEGYKKHGNKIFIGDKDSDYLAINENGLYSNNIYPSCELKQDKKYLTDGINSYASGMSVMLVSYAFGSSNGFPGNTSGVLITYRFSTKYAFYNKQEFLQNTSNKKYVRYALTDTTWSAFEEIMTSTSVPYKIAGTNAYTASSPITEYPTKSIVTFPVNFNGSTGFAPTQSAGVVTVYRIYGNGWDRREFRKHNSNEIYASYVDGSTGQWSAPVKISAV